MKDPCKHLLIIQLRGYSPFKHTVQEIRLIAYHFAEGWSVGSSSNITANWIASGGKWTVPVGGGFGKAFQLNGQPVKLDLDAYYNASRPKAGNETWLLQVTLTFQFPD
jgi:hypothetical protein